MNMNLSSAENWVLFSKTLEYKALVAKSKKTNEFIQTITYSTANKFIGKTINDFAKNFNLEINPKFNIIEFNDPIKSIRLKQGYGGRLHILTESGFWGIYRTDPLNSFIGLSSTSNEKNKWFKLL